MRSGKTDYHTTSPLRPIHRCAYFLFNKFCIAW